MAKSYCVECGKKLNLFTGLGCSNCGRIICSGCGISLKKYVTTNICCILCAIRILNDRKKELKLICAKCGLECEFKHIFCPSCGNKLEKLKFDKNKNK